MNRSFNQMPSGSSENEFVSKTQQFQANTNPFNNEKQQQHSTMGHAMPPRNQNHYLSNNQGNQLNWQNSANPLNQNLTATTLNKSMIISTPIQQKKIGFNSLENSGVSDTRLNTTMSSSTKNQPMSAFSNFQASSNCETKLNFNSGGSNSDMNFKSGSFNSNKSMEFNRQNEVSDHQKVNTAGKGHDQSINKRGNQNNDSFQKVSEFSIPRQSDNTQVQNILSTKQHEQQYQTPIRYNTQVKSSFILERLMYHRQMNQQQQQQVKAQLSQSRTHSRFAQSTYTRNQKPFLVQDEEQTFEIMEKYTNLNQLFLEECTHLQSSTEKLLKSQEELISIIQIEKSDSDREFDESINQYGQGNNQLIRKLDQQLEGRVYIKNLEERLDQVQSLFQYHDNCINFSNFETTKIEVIIPETKPRQQTSIQNSTYMNQNSNSTNQNNKTSQSKSSGQSLCLSNILSSNSGQFERIQHRNQENQGEIYNKSEAEIPFVQENGAILIGGDSKAEGILESEYYDGYDYDNIQSEDFYSLNGEKNSHERLTNIASPNNQRDKMQNQGFLDSPDTNFQQYNIRRRNLNKSSFQPNRDNLNDSQFDDMISIQKSNTHSSFPFYGQYDQEVGQALQNKEQFPNKSTINLQKKSKKRRHEEISYQEKIDRLFNQSSLTKKE
eukprot:403344021